MTWPAFARDEVTQRVANFKAHQKRMQSEREDYYLQTMARARAVIDNARAPKKKMIQGGALSGKRNIPSQECRGLAGQSLPLRRRIETTSSRSWMGCIPKKINVSARAGGG
jgi:hypothetical protein